MAGFLPGTGRGLGGASSLSLLWRRSTLRGRDPGGGGWVGGLLSQDILDTGNILLQRIGLGFQEIKFREYNLKMPGNVWAIMT